MGSKPTPRPWVRSKSGTCVELPNGSQFRLVKCADDQNPCADAAHIVKCVNMHEELVEALERARIFFTATPKELMPNGLMDDIESALAKATGGEE